MALPDLEWLVRRAVSTSDYDLDDDYDDDESAEHCYLRFSVAEESYALPVATVTEIVEPGAMRRVPDVPAFVIGVVNLRGKVLPVVDVRKRFGLPEAPPDTRPILIVVDVGVAHSGLLVDRVEEVVDIPPSAIEPPADWHQSAGDGNVVLGLGRTGETLSVLLDLATFLTPASLDLRPPVGTPPPPPPRPQGD